MHSWFRPTQPAWSQDADNEGVARGEGHAAPRDPREPIREPANEPPRRVMQGGLLAAFKSGHGTHTASELKRQSSQVQRPQTASHAQVKSASVDAEVEDCLKLAASLDDETWDDLDDSAEHAGGPSGYGRSSKEAQGVMRDEGSPSKRRKVQQSSAVDHPEEHALPRFKPFVPGAPPSAAVLQSNAHAALSQAEPRTRPSAGRFLIPAEDREGLSLAAAECAGLGLYAAPTENVTYGRDSGKEVSSSDPVEDFPSSETAFMSHNAAHSSSSDGRFGKAGVTSLPSLAISRTQPTCHAGQPGRRSEGAGPDPRTPNDIAIPEPSSPAPSLSLCLSSPMGSSSPIRRGGGPASSVHTQDLQMPLRAPDVDANAGTAPTNDAHGQGGRAGLGRALSGVQASVQIALQQSLGGAQREWDKERRAFLRKLDAKDKTIRCLREKLSHQTSYSAQR